MEPPLDFLFFPRPFQIAPFASTSTQDQAKVQCYLYGWFEGETGIVVGGIEDTSKRNVDARLSTLAGSIPHAMSHNLTVLGTYGRWDEKGKSKAREERISISISPDGTPFASTAETSIIIYYPPSLSQLQFLSLDPLQLDLASFSTPLTDSIRMKRDDSKANEQTLLSRNIKAAVSLDFTACDKLSISQINLQNVIDKVSDCLYS